MEWTEQQKKEMEEIVDEVDCPNDFKCFKLEPEEILKARNIGIEGYLDCSEDKPQECEFALPFGEKYICKCPVRVYIAQNTES